MLRCCFVNRWISGHIHQHHCECHREKLVLNLSYSKFPNRVQSREYRSRIQHAIRIYIFADGFCFMTTEHCMPISCQQTILQLEVLMTFMIMDFLRRQHTQTQFAVLCRAPHSVTALFFLHQASLCSPWTNLIYREGGLAHTCVLIRQSYTVFARPNQKGDVEKCYADYVLMFGN